MNKGTELAERLLNNIHTSIELRTRIPYLDMLRDLIEGGVTPTTAMMNTSSNFGSFDNNLKVVLSLLSEENSLINNPVTASPLPLSSILVNLTSNRDLLTKLFQDAVDDQLRASNINIPVAKLILESLEQVNRASV